MRSKYSTAFQTVKEIENNLSNLQISKEIYSTPYTGKPLVTKSEYVEGEQMYATEDIAFVNTKEFSKTGDFFLKNGVYTNAHPVYDREEYTRFWDEEEKRRKNGMVLPGKLIKENGIWKLQEVHITGEHYGYLNYGEIKRSKDFENKGGILFSPNGEKLALENKGRGTTKKSKLLPAFWDGDYYFFKAVELCREVERHLVVGKARRKGYSYKNGFLVANLADLYPNSTSVVGAYDGASLFEDGTMNKVQGYLDFICKHTDWKKRRLHNRLEHIEIGYRFAGDPVKRGFLSNIYTAILAKDPGGLRGKDADFIIVEEVGKMVNFAEVLAPTLKTLEDGIHMTGLMIVFGTGGGDDKYWQAFEDLFYSTYEQKFITFDNVWDEELDGTGCGFFHSAFMSKPGLIDVHGNSDVRGAIEFEMKERAKLKNNPVKLNNYVMEEPFSPGEAFSRAGNSMMPTRELDVQLRKVLYDPDLKNLGREGIFIEEKGKIKFYDRNILGSSLMNPIPPVVNDYPLKPDTVVEGCWVLWEQPYRDPRTGEIPENLYRVWNDPFGISKDAEEFTLKDSLGGTYLYEVGNNFTPTKGDRIIAEYVGRTEDMEDYDRQMFLGAVYYNAKILYENDRGEVYTNAKKLGYLDLLVDEPEFMYQKDLQAGGKGRKKGISIATNVNRKINGAIYVKKWLTEKRGEDQYGNKLLNLHYIYSAGLLRELIKYDGKRNADRVSTLIIGMYDIRELLHKGINPDVQSYHAINDTYFN